MGLTENESGARARALSSPVAPEDNYELEDCRFSTIIKSTGDLGTPKALHEQKPRWGLGRCFSGGVVGSLIVLHTLPILARKDIPCRGLGQGSYEALSKKLHRYICRVIPATMLLVAESM